MIVVVSRHGDILIDEFVLKVFGHLAGITDHGAILLSNEIRVSANEDFWQKILSC